MAFQVFAAIVAVYATAIVFDVPSKLRIYISLLGGLGWFCYLSFLNPYGFIVATYLSSFLIAFFSHLGARKFKVPVTVFFIPSFFPGQHLTSSFAYQFAHIKASVYILCYFATLNQI